MKITIWNEYHNQNKGKVKKTYPDGMHNAIKSIFDDAGVEASAVTMDMPSQGLTDGLLNNTDVLIWWGHSRHDEVDDILVEKICRRVKEDGMGAIFLHSAHLSKPFTKLINASGALNWRDIGERERVWTINLSHPIAKGVEQGFVLKNEEMYGETFDIGTPAEVIFAGWFKGGEVFRSGVTFNAGKGKLFYFQPGHETYPTYYNKNIRKIILNAAAFVAPESSVPNSLKPQEVAYEHSGKCKHVRRML